MPGMKPLETDCAEDLVLELVARAALEGLDLEDDAGVLAVAAGLLLVRVLGARLLGDRLAVGDARHPGLDRDLLGVLDLVEDHVDLELAHAGDDRLLGLGVEVDLEGEVLLRGLVEELGELVLFLLVDRGDGERVDGLRQPEGLEGEGLVVAERVSFVLSEALLAMMPMSPASSSWTSSSFLP